MRNLYLERAGQLVRVQQEDDKAARKKLLRLRRAFSEEADRILSEANDG